MWTSPIACHNKHPHRHTKCSPHMRSTYWIHLLVFTTAKFYSSTYNSKVLDISTSTYTIIFFSLMEKSSPSLDFNFKQHKHLVPIMPKYKTMQILLHTIRLLVVDTKRFHNFLIITLIFYSHMILVSYNKWMIHWIIKCFYK